MKKIMLMGLILTGISFWGPNPLNAKDFDTMEMCIDSTGPRTKQYPTFWWESKEKIKLEIEKMEKSGINVVMPSIYAHGFYFFKTPNALYKKGVMPDKLGYDPLELLIIEAKKKNMKVVPVFSFLAGAGEENCIKTLSGNEIPHTDWFNMDMYGNTKNGHSFSYDPANPELRKYLATLVEDLTKYDIDGLMLDYIRYIGPQWGYTPKARELFESEYGVDPLVLSNNPDKIDNVMLYCLKPLAWKEKNWYFSQLLTVLKKTGVSYKMIEETSDGITDIPPKSILLLASCYKLSEKEISQLDMLLEKGGDIIFIDGPTTAMNNNEKSLGPILGLKKEHKYFHNKELLMTPVSEHSIVKGVENAKITSSGNSFLRQSMTTSKEIVSLDDKYPGIILNSYKKGNVVLFNYDMLMANSTDNADSKFLKNTINWLAEKRKLRLYYYLPNDVLLKYSWIPAITKTFFNIAKTAPLPISNIEGLKTLAALDKEEIKKTSLIYTTYFDPGKESVKLICDYIGKGGNLIIFLDKDVNIKDMATGADAIMKYPELFNLLALGKPLKADGSKDNNGHNYAIMKFQSGNEPSPLLKNVPDTSVDFYGDRFAETDKNTVVLRMDNSTPALFHCKSGDGNIWIFNYGMNTTANPPAILLNNLIKDIADTQGVNCFSDKISNLMEQWDAWRCNQVTTMVKMIKEVMQKNKPGIPLSIAAVDNNEPEKVVFQDWKTWLKNGYIDTVYPMDYFADNAKLKQMLVWQMEGFENKDKSKIRPLIRLYKKGTDNKVSCSVTAEELSSQIKVLKDEGYRNIGFFSDSFISEEVMKELKKSAE